MILTRTEIATSAESPWLRVFRRSARPKIRLLCFPHAGGAASMFRTWADRLPGETEVWAVCLPGREQRLAERPADRIDAVLDGVWRAVESLLEVPLVLFGHSMGAIMALEFAHHMRDTRCVEPHRLIISAAAPGRAFGEDFRYASDAELLTTIAKSWGALPDEVLASVEMRSMILATMRADLHLLATCYRNHPSPLTCAIDALGGADDHSIPASVLEGWCGHTNGPFSLKMFPGGHMFIAAPNARSFLDVICERLTRVVNGQEERGCDAAG